MRPFGKQAHPPRVQGKLVLALKAMVWEGQDLQQAAATAGLTTHAVRLALERPHVKAFLREQKEVFRAHASSQNIHRAVHIRDTSDNAMAVMRAITYIDDKDDEAAASGAARRAPGLIVQIVNSNVALMAHEQADEAKQLIDQQPGSQTSEQRDD